jgi:tetratricopeptide (TPR) repeat protein
MEGLAGAACYPVAGRRGKRIFFRTSTLSAIKGYHDVPPADQKKAKDFFAKGKTIADTGSYDYAIELYMQGLSLDPEAIDAHQALREISMKRKASGGKDLGMNDRWKLSKPTKDDKQNMLNAEKLLAYDPGNTDRMVTILQNGHKAGFYDTALWIGPILQKANADSKKPDFNKFIILKDVYKLLEQWKLATDACQFARRMRPDDMDLSTELKNLGAQHTMTHGGYESGKSFRESIKDMEGQQKQMEADKDIRTEDSLARTLRDARAEFDAAPDDPIKLNKFIEALRKTEQLEHENEAIEMLDNIYRKTSQFIWRRKAGEIKISQLSRMERSLRAAVQSEPKDVELRKDYLQFQQDRYQAELEEFQLVVQNYPTNNDAKFEVAARLFKLRKFLDAIQIFQQVRSDPKHRARANVMLGQCFLQAGFADEAVDTLREAIENHAAAGDDRSKEMYYWYGRALEEKNDPQSALKAYSKLVQWDFNFLDVQERIKKLRSLTPTQ